MKRTDIRAGVVYAVKSSYGPPSPIVFLEDGARGIYSRSPYGRGAPVERDPKRYKPKRGRGWEGTDCGYAAIRGGSAREGEAAELLRSVDLPAELARFLADKMPTADGLSFEIVTGLGKIDGLYDEELAAYEARQEAERAERKREQGEAEAARNRADAITFRLSAFDVDAEAVSKDREHWSHIVIPVADAEKLLALLAAKEA